MRNGATHQAQNGTGGSLLYNSLFAGYAQAQNTLQDMTLFKRFRLQFREVCPQITLEVLELDCTA